MTKRLYNTFEFIGDVVLPKDENEIIREYNYDSGASKKSLGLGVRSGNSTQFLDIEAWKPRPDETIRIYSIENKNEYIPFDQRNNPEVLARATNLTKIIVDLETDFEKKEKYTQLFFKILNLSNRQDELSIDEKQKLEKYKEEYNSLTENRHEFLAMYDVIPFLREEIVKHKNSKIRVIGDVKVSMSKGKIYKNYIPSLIEIVDVNTPTKLQATLDIFFDGDALDKSNIKEDKKIYIDGYLLDWHSASKGERFFPQQFVLDVSKINLEDPMQQKILEFMLKQFDTPRRQVSHMQFDCEVVDGAEIIGGDSISLSDLSKTQRMAVELGLSKLSDFATVPVIGDRIQEIRIKKPRVDNTMFAEGALEYMDEDSFANLIVQDQSAVSVSDVLLDEIKEGSVDPVDTEEEEIVSEDDLMADLEDLF